MSTPRIEELISGAIGSALSELHGHTVARVDTYDPVTRTATVQPLIRRPALDGNEEITHEEEPAVQNVPVLCLGCSTFNLVFDLLPGDTVLLCYLDFAPTGWLERGAPSDAGDAQQSGPSYPVAIPWYRPLGQAGAPDPGPSVGLPGGAGTPARVVFGPTGVTVGAGASFVALATLVSTELAKIAAALASLTVTTGVGAGGTVAAGTPYSPGPVASSGLKSD